MASQAKQVLLSPRHMQSLRTIAERQPDNVASAIAQAVQLALRLVISAATMSGAKTTTADILLTGMLLIRHLAEKLQEQFPRHIEFELAAFHIFTEEVNAQMAAIKQGGR